MGGGKRRSGMTNLRYASGETEVTETIEKLLLALIELKKRLSTQQ
jgi:hypothetical protein